MMPMFCRVSLTLLPPSLPLRVWKSSEEAYGIDCILSTQTQQFTYRITRGVASYVGEGDLHDPKYDDWCESKSLTSKSSKHEHGTSASFEDQQREFYSNSSASYSLKLYPTDEFIQVYSTKNPITSAVGAVLIVLMTIFAFLVYDALVRKEFNDKVRRLVTSACTSFCSDRLLRC